MIFSQNLSIPSDPSEINSDVIKIEIVHDESNIEETSEFSEITWSLKSFKKKQMII